MDITLATPASTPSKAATTSASLALWNPRAATWWGIALSPAFSAFIHMRNWQALGDADKTREARIWFCMTFGYLVLCCVLAGVSEMIGRDIAPPTSAWLGILVGWHLWGGRAQERYVAVLTGGEYVRRPWSRIVLGALGVFFALVFVVATVSRLAAP